MTSPVRAPRPTPRRTPQPAPRGAHLRVVSTPAARTPRSSRPTRHEVRRRRRGAVVVVAMAIVFGGLLSSAFVHGQMAGGQTKLDRLDAQLQQERAALARDRVELADLRSPQRISEAATELGMVTADTQHWVSAATGDETVVTRDGDPTADQTDTNTTGSNQPNSGGSGSSNELAGSATGSGAR